MKETTQEATKKETEGTKKERETGRRPTERTIRDCLARMKRYDLTNLAFRLNLEPPPRGRAEMAAWRETMAAKLPEMGRTVRECLGLTGVENLLDCLAECDGALSVPQRRMQGTDAEFDLYTLLDMGLAWRDRTRWHIQPCVPAMLEVEDQAERTLLKAGDDLEDVVSGYLMLYGMLRAEEVQRMILGVENREALEIVLAVWTRRRGLPGVYLTQKEIWLLDDAVTDPGELYRQVHRPDRVNVPYAVYDEKRARAALDLGVAGDPAVVKQLVALGRKLRLKRADLLGFIGMAEDAFRRDDRHGAVEIITAVFAQSSYAALGEMLAAAYVNSIPAWPVKGHTLAEVHEEDRPRRAAWSDPCPCGSGRTYGRCCGRLN